MFFLKTNHTRFFTIYIKTLEYGKESNYKILQLQDKAIIKKIINFQRIKAKRDVANVDGTKRTSDKTLSKMSSRYYERIVACICRSCVGNFRFFEN